MQLQLPIRRKNINLAFLILLICITLLLSSLASAQATCEEALNMAGGKACEYDSNKNNQIDDSEIIQAVSDWTTNGNPNDIEIQGLTYLNKNKYACISLFSSHCGDGDGGGRKPDLTIASLTVNPSDLRTYESIIFKIIVKNIGNAKPPKAVRLYIQEDGKDTCVFNTLSPSSLEPGESVLQTCYNTGGYSAGTHKVEAFADPYNEIDESNEGNNIKSVSFTVGSGDGGGGKPTSCDEAGSKAGKKACKYDWNKNNKIDDNEINQAVADWTTNGDPNDNEISGMTYIWENKCDIAAQCTSSPTTTTTTTPIPSSTTTTTNIPPQPTSCDEAGSKAGKKACKYDTNNNYFIDSNEVIEANKDWIQNGDPNDNEILGIVYIWEHGCDISQLCGGEPIYYWESDEDCPNGCCGNDCCGVVPTTPPITTTPVPTTPPITTTPVPTTPPITTTPVPTTTTTTTLPKNCQTLCGGEGYKYGTCRGKKLDCVSEGEVGDLDTEPDKKCCPGLYSVPKLNPDSCKELPGNKFDCIKCGNQICGPGENSCNCPKDCTGEGTTTTTCCPATTTTSTIPVDCDLKMVKINPECELGDSEFCEVGEPVLVNVEYEGAQCPKPAYIQVDAQSKDGSCKIENVGGALKGISVKCDSSPCAEYWEFPTIPKECLCKEIVVKASAIWAVAISEGEWIDGYKPAGTFKFACESGKGTTTTTCCPGGTTTTTIQKDCTLNSVKITPECELGNSTVCEVGEPILVEADYSGTECPSTALIQVDAIGPNGKCNIQNKGGDLQGISVSCDSSPCAEYWNITSIPKDCAGNVIQAKEAAIWEGKISTGTWISGRQPTGEFKFASTQLNIVGSAISLPWPFNKILNGGGAGGCVGYGKWGDRSIEPNLQCCEGLYEVPHIDESTCDIIPDLKFACIKCGNGNCDPGENKCNCPDDCGQGPPPAGICLDGEEPLGYDGCLFGDVCCCSNVLVNVTTTTSTTTTLPPGVTTTTTSLPPGVTTTTTTLPPGVTTTTTTANEGTTTTTTLQGKFITSNFSCEELKQSTPKKSYVCNLGYESTLPEEAVWIVFMLKETVNYKVLNHVFYTCEEVSNGTAKARFDCPEAGKDYSISWNAFLTSDKNLINPITWSKTTDWQTLNC